MASRILIPDPSLLPAKYRRHVVIADFIQEARMRFRGIRLHRWGEFLTRTRHPIRRRWSRQAVSQGVISWLSIITPGHALLPIAGSEIFWLFVTIRGLVTASDWERIRFKIDHEGTSLLHQESNRLNGTWFGNVSMFISLLLYSDTVNVFELTKEARIYLTKNPQ